MTVYGIQLCTQWLELIIKGFYISHIQGIGMITLMSDLVFIYKVLFYSVVNDINKNTDTFL